jgi:thiaminase/transcriptional activator TenA
VVVDFIDLVETASQHADEATLVEMKKHFIMSCKLEHMFWDQALEQMQWPEHIPKV